MLHRRCVECSSAHHHASTEHSRMCPLTVLELDSDVVAPLRQCVLEHVANEVDDAVPHDRVSCHSVSEDVCKGRAIVVDLAVTLPLRDAVRKFWHMTILLRNASPLIMPAPHPAAGRRTPAADSRA